MSINVLISKEIVGCFYDDERNKLIWKDKVENAVNYRITFI